MSLGLCFEDYRATLCEMAFGTALLRGHLARPVLHQEGREAKRKSSKKLRCGKSSIVPQRGGNAKTLQGEKAQWTPRFGTQRVFDRRADKLIV